MKHKTLIVSTWFLLIVASAMQVLPAQAQTTPCSDMEIYDHKKEKCVCRWGDIETPFKKGQKVGEAFRSICDYVEKLGVGAFGDLLNLIIVGMTVLVVAAGVMSTVIGGYYYMTAGGSADRVRAAKNWIGTALIGIIIALLAWIILFSISPNLV